MNTVISATLCYIRKGNKTLMMHRTKKRDSSKNLWNGLGGKCDPGESPEECVIREVHEESGLTITKPKLKGVITYPAFADRKDWIVFVYVVDTFTGTLIDNSECKEGELSWIDTKKLPSLHLWDGDIHFLPWLDKKKFFSAKFIYDKHKYVNHTVTFY